MNEVCPCHGEPWYISGKQRRRSCHVKRRAAWRIARKRYLNTEGGARNNEKHRGWGGTRTQRARAARIAQRKEAT